MVTTQHPVAEQFPGEYCPYCGRLRAEVWNRYHTTPSTMIISFTTSSCTEPLQQYIPSPRYPFICYGDSLDGFCGQYTVEQRLVDDEQKQTLMDQIDMLLATLPDDDGFFSSEATTVFDPFLLDNDEEEGD